MKTMGIFISLAIFLPAIIVAEDQKLAYMAVQKSDCGRRVTYEALTSEQLKDAQDSVKIDAANFGKAVSAVEKKWRADKDLKSYPFQKGAMAAPKITVAGTFDSLDKANDKVTALEREMKEQETKEKEKAKKKDKKKSDKDKGDKHLEPEELLEKSISMVETELQELKAKQAEAAGGGK